MQGDEFLAVDVDGAARLFAGAGQADANVRGFGFTGSIDDTAHHGKSHFFDTFILLFPLRHAVTDVFLNPLGEFLKRRAGGAPAARAGRHACAAQERPQAQCLKQFA